MGDDVVDRAIDYLCKRKISVPIFFLVSVIVSLLMLPRVSINYDLAEYLPEDSNTKQAIAILEENFGYPGTAEVMVEDISIAEAQKLKERLAEIDGVKSVIWLDDLADPAKPLQTIPEEIRDGYYKNNTALFQVQFDEFDYSQKTSQAIIKIRELVGEDAAISGPAENSRHMKEILAGEISKILLIVVPLCLVILMLASSSWIEPLLYIGIIGVSIVINMGTNIIFKSVSFITYSMASVLQLAMAMDYALFLMHRYLEERDSGKGVQSAIVIAVRKSLSSIAASALTTIAGFLALIVMNYQIGKDIGLVLAKGILISFLTVIILMPVIIVLLNRVIDKTRHRNFSPSFNKIGQHVLKFRIVIVVLALIMVVPAFLAQRSNEFLFGDSSATSAEGKAAEQSQRISETFGVNNAVLLLVPSGYPAAEKALAEELKSQGYIKDVQGLVTLADPSIPREYLPKSVRDNFDSGGYSRFIINLRVQGENDQSFAAVDQIKNTAEKHYPGQWLTAGSITSIADIRSTVNEDIFSVNLYSILAVAMIILLTLRSVSLPIILVAVIELSTWINMSIPYFAGEKLAFIGYLVVSSLQLGATIDYAILLANRYMEFRKDLLPKEAAQAAIKAAGSSIVISALILSSAGLSFGFISEIDEIKAIGMLIGRGAAISGLLVLTLLPALLIMLDKVVMKTSLK
ncbi:MAG TPA: MMPL family transporter [Clostridiales bacterium]|nr:MMPL family transporter [Clostridiales bacterium]